MKLGAFVQHFEMKISLQLYDGACFGDLLMRFRTSVLHLILRKWTGMSENGLWSRLEPDYFSFLLSFKSVVIQA